MRLTIIIPIKSKWSTELEEFTDYIIKLDEEIEERKLQFEIIIANESEAKSYGLMNQKLCMSNNIVHFVPESKYREGQNDKSNGVYAAYKRAKYENILLVDDHYRVSLKTLIELYPYYGKYDSFKMMPVFNEYGLDVQIDLCGMYFVNIVDYKKQYCGHLAFRKSVFQEIGFPCRNSLFDEYAFESHIRNEEYEIGFVDDIFLEAVQKISVKKFFEQRIRYAYENLSMPFRFSMHLLLLPLALTIALISIQNLVWFVFIINAFVMIISLFGQIKHKPPNSPYYTFLLSPIWFWFYPFTSWIAVLKFFTGGVYFGGKKVRKA